MEGGTSWPRPFISSGVGQSHLSDTAIPIGKAFSPIRDEAPGSHDNLPVTHKHDFVVLAIDRNTGGVVWRKSVRQLVPHEGSHYTASFSVASPITDGERVYAYFGSVGMYCLSNEGALLWKRDFGKMQTKHAHGEGASAVLANDALVVNWDHEGQSFVEVLDAKSGKTRWRRQRNEVTSWATPIVVKHQGRHLAIISGTSRVRAYDLESGDIIWSCGGLSANIVASPVSAGRHGLCRQ